VTYEKLLAIKMAQEATLLDYLHEVEHGTARIARLDSAITEAVKSAPPQMRAVIEALQALRGIAHVSAVTVVAELGELSRFARARQLMAYGGIVPSEDSSGERTRRGNITKTGNAHLRRVVVEASVGLPAPTVRGGKVAEAASACQRRGQRDLLESATAVASALSKVAGQGQEQRRWL
jgi:transposase